MGARIAAKLNERLLLRHRVPQLLKLVNRARCEARIMIVYINIGRDAAPYRALANVDPTH